MIATALNSPFTFATASPSGFSPLDIAGCKLWLKADALSLSDSDPVSTWTDSSGLGNNATQSGSARPTFKTSIINSLPVIRFDGADDFMNISSISIGSACSVFVVIKQATLSALKLFLSGGTNPYFSSDVVGGNNFYINDAAGTLAGSTGGYSITDFCLFEYVAGAAGRETWVNGTSKGSSGTAAAASQTISNVSGLAGSFLWNGDIAEIIVYDSAIGSTDRGSLEGYLLDKYAL